MRVPLASRLGLLLVPALAAGLTVLTAAPALAQTQVATDNPLVVVTGRADVPATSTVDGVLILDGPALVAGASTDGVFAANGDVTVLGSVDGDVIVLNGDVTVGGTVTGSVTATSGQARVVGTGTVQGDVESSATPRVAPLATVGGTVKQTDFATRFQAAGWVALVLWWVGVSLLTLAAGLLLLLFFRRAGDASVRMGRGAVGGSFLAGLVVLVAVPAVATAILFTLVGIPLGVAVLLGVALLMPVGYAVTAAVLGSLVVKRSRVGAFVAGWAALRVVALVPGLGALVWTVAALYGVGALTMAALRSRREPPETVAAPTAAPMSAPPSQDVPDPRPTWDVPSETRDREP